jgi:hypothetical protein
MLRTPQTCYMRYETVELTLVEWQDTDRMKDAEVKDEFEDCNTSALIAHLLRILFWRRKIPARDHVLDHKCFWTRRAVMKCTTPSERYQEMNLQECSWEYLSECDRNELDTVMDVNKISNS